MSIFRINGLGFSDSAQLVATSGFLAVFFFLTLYMQEVLRYSPLETALAYIPLALAIGLSASVTSQLLSRVGTRAPIVVGALVTAAGFYWLSKIPVGGSYFSTLLPGMLVLSLGIGVAFVAVTTIANTGVPADKAGLAAALLNASQQIGGRWGWPFSRSSHRIALTIS
ncbi:MAG: MFS transporter [Solirubrobacteraceae bacterium]